MIQTLNSSVKQYKMVDWGDEDVMAALENDPFQQVFPDEEEVRPCIPPSISLHTLTTRLDDVQDAPVPTSNSDDTPQELNLPSHPTPDDTTSDVESPLARKQVRLRFLTKRIDLING
jgi:hypothetical protein